MFILRVCSLFQRLRIFFVKIMFELIDVLKENLFYHKKTAFNTDLIERR